MECYLCNDWECCWYVVCCVFFVFTPLLPSVFVLYAVHSLLPCSAIAQLKTDSLMVVVIPSIRVHRPRCWTDGALGYQET